MHCFEWESSSDKQAANKPSERCQAIVPLARQRHFVADVLAVVLLLVNFI